MIDLAKLNKTFLQQPTSCVLSSYGIIANYFSQTIPVDEAFVSYCNHYNINYQNNRITAENLYATHFTNEWNIQHCRGGELILAIHRVSRITYFENNRKLFYGEFIMDVNAQLAYIGNKLQNSPSFLSVGYNNPGGGFHNIVVGADKAKDSFFVRDPAKNTGMNGFKTISQLTGVGTLRDGTLFIGI